METRQHTFVAPSGYKYTIREQNGGDDDVISNAATARSLLNISTFISRIVVDTDSTVSRKLTVQDAHNMPALDWYCILIQSRIFSIGDKVEFEFDWGAENGGKLAYEVDLKDYLYDYSLPLENTQECIERLQSKPEAIPYYPTSTSERIQIELETGKKLNCKHLDAEGQAYQINLPLDQQTKNQGLIARDLNLLVDGKYEKVTNFDLFDRKEMIKIREEVKVKDPVFHGRVIISNPNNTSLPAQYINLLGLEGFFYPEEIY